MTFVIKTHQHKKFFIDITLGEDTVSYELEALSYMRWNEIGLMVKAETAPKIKDPNNPKKYIEDRKRQDELNAEAELLRNAMRIVVALEGGEGIEWGDDAPDTLEGKAEVFASVDTVMFLGLLTGLRNRAFGGKVTAEDADARFRRLQAESDASDKHV